MKASGVCLKIIPFSEKALQHVGTDPDEERTAPVICNAASVGIKDFLRL